jgi:hypothetical protein
MFIQRMRVLSCLLGKLQDFPEFDWVAPLGLQGWGQHFGKSHFFPFTFRDQMVVIFAQSLSQSK